jgi:GNAT superfamily N-acetyltransferase
VELTSESIIVRPAAAEDTAAVQSFLARVWEDDYVPEAWGDWLKDPNGVLLVAAADGKPVGIAHADFQSGREAWFEGMRVDPDYRRMKVGSKLTNALLSACWNKGIETVHLGIEEYNLPSQTMTMRSGFSVIARYDWLRSEANTPLAPFDRPRLPREDELKALMDVAHETNRRDGTPLAAFWEWNWQMLTEESLKSLYDRQALRVHPTKGPQAWCAFVKFGNEGEDAKQGDGYFFSPYGEPAAIAELVRGLYYETSDGGIPGEFGGYVYRGADCIKAIEQSAMRHKLENDKAFDGYEYEGWQIWELRRGESSTS